MMPVIMVLGVLLLAVVVLVALRKHSMRFHLQFLGARVDLEAKDQDR